jgi:hypothetical protein
MDQINIFNNAMAKADFKEKLGRVLQYGARMVSGLLTDADKLSPSKDRQATIAKVYRSIKSSWSLSLGQRVPICSRRFPPNI